MNEKNTTIDTAVATVCMITGAAVIEYCAAIMIGEALCKVYEAIDKKLAETKR